MFTFCFKKSFLEKRIVTFTLRAPTCCDLNIFDWNFHHLKENRVVFKMVCGKFLIYFRMRTVSKFVLKNRFYKL